MKRIRCYNYAGDYVNSLVQWDRNQVVYVDDLENGAVPGVHYASTGYKDVSWEFTDVASLADDGRVKIKIPDIMMQYDGKLYLFLFYGENETIATTKYVVELTVKEKPKPDDWVWADETWYKTMQQIQIDVNKVLSITESKVNNPSEGKVGQILEIASVDMNGKPLTYIAVDKPRSITDDDIISPIATVTQTDTGATISIQDKNGTTTANIIHGRDGKDGENGQDGYTPVKGVDYFDGEKGDKGDKGDDGYTPQKGVDYFDGQDGKDGEKGADGTSVTVSNVSESIADGGSNVVTFSDGKTLTIKNGSKGKDGEKGEDGKDYVLTDADKQEIVQTIEDNVSVNIPTKTSQLENDSDYVTKDVTDNLSEQLANKEASGTAQSKVTEHNIAKDSHNDIRLLITNLSNLVSNLLDSDDETLNQTSEIVAYIKSNKTLIDAITTSKVSISDIVDNLTTNVSNKPLSAKQGLVLKGLIDAIVIPTLLSQLGEDANHRTVTDAEKATWNAKSNFSGAYADLSGKPTIPSKTSQLTNDSGFLTQHQSLSGYAKTADHYTKTESDNKYQSKGNYLTAVPSEYVTETELNAKGYLTAVPSEYVTETELTAKKYLTSIPSEYVTETELTAKKYATQTDVNKFGGTIEVTSGNPTKENTVLTINPNADEVNVYTSDEVDAIASRLEGQKADKTYVDNEIISVKATQMQMHPLFKDSLEELKATGDTSKLYVLPDGEIYAYMQSESPEVTIPNFTNQLAISKDANGAVYNGKGYKENTRISTSSGYAEAFLDNVFLTGYMEAKIGDTFYFENITFTEDAYSNLCYLYDSSRTGLAGSAVITSWFNPVKDSNGNVIAITIPNSPSFPDIGYVRFGARIINDTSVIAKNEPIEYITVGGTEVGWKSTGHAFPTPADYEDRIIAEEKLSEYILSELEDLKEQKGDNEDFADQYDFRKYGLPILSLAGDTTGMSKDVKKTLNYIYEGRSGTCTLKWQGSSSLSYEKKNYTIVFDNPFEAKSGWGSQAKYCLKANFIDHSHARNIVSAKLWGKLVKSRTNVDSRLNALPNGGAIDGFPIVIELNGEFHGLYTFNIPKEAWMFGMDGTGQQAILCAESPSNLTSAASFNSLAVLDGTDFDLEYSSDDESAWVVTSINRLIQAVMDSDGSDLDTTLAQYIDWDSAIDHYIFTTLLQAEDNVIKNYLLSTYDGVKWFFTEYDMDTTYGLYWTGKRFYANDECHQFRTRTFDKLMNLIWTYKRPQLRARYNELRADIMAEDKVAREFLNFSVSIPSPILDMDVKAHPTIPSSAVNNVYQILNNYRLRVVLCDEWIKYTNGEKTT